MDIPKEAFTSEIQVRFIDTDQAGHVNHATFLSFMETARVEWIKEEAKTGMGKVPIIVARVEIDYRQPITLFAEPTVSMWVSRIGTKSFDMDYVIHGMDHDQQIIFAEAKTVIVHFNYETHQSEPIPYPIRSMLQRYQPTP